MVTRPDVETREKTHRWPDLLPDGKSELFTTGYADLASFDDAQIEVLSGREEIYVQPFPGPGRRWQISTAGGRESVWGRNRRELFYRNGNKMMVVRVATEAAFTATTPTRLFEGGFVPGNEGSLSRTNYDVTPDGERFVMIKRSPASKVPELHLVQNWC